MGASKWLWRVAVVSFFAAITVGAVQAATGTDDGHRDTLFTFPQVALLMAVAAAWGDMRTNRSRDRDEFKKLREDVDDIAKKVGNKD